MGESGRSLGDPLLLQPSSQHARWWAWPLLLLGVALVGVLAAAYATWDRTAFMARCLRNGNAWQGCSCTYGALPDLPANYRKLARTWAHGSATDYTIAVMTLAVLETARAAQRRVRAMAPTNGKHRTIRAWIADATVKLLGWKAVAATVSGVSPKAVVVVSGVVAGDVGWTFAKARAAMGRHCGGSADTFILRVVVDDDTNRFATGLGRMRSNIVELTGCQLRDGCDVVEKCEQATHNGWSSLLKTTDREHEHSVFFQTIRTFSRAGITTCATKRTPMRS